MIRLNNSNKTSLKEKSSEPESQIFRFLVYSLVAALIETIILGGVYNFNNIWKYCLSSGSTIGLLLYDAINDNQAWKAQWKEKHFFWIEFWGIIFIVATSSAIPFALDFFVFTHLVTLPLIYKFAISVCVFITSFLENFIVSFTLLLFCFKWPIIPKIVTLFYKLLHRIIYFK